MSLALDFLDVFYGDDEFTNFSAQLLRLIQKADIGNLNKLRQVYPAHVTLFEWWQGTPEPEPDLVRQKATEIEAEFPS